MIETGWSYRIINVPKDIEQISSKELKKYFNTKKDFVLGEDKSWNFGDKCLHLQYQFGSLTWVCDMYDMKSFESFEKDFDYKEILLLNAWKEA